jgi:hypothetical protein
MDISTKEIHKMANEHMKEMPRPSATREMQIKGHSQISYTIGCYNKNLDSNRC